MALAGKDLVLQASADDSAYNTISGANQADLDELRELLDDTEFGDQAKSKFAGIKDSSASVGVDYLVGDTGQGRLDTAFDNGSTVYLKLLWNGSAGQKFTGKVANRKTSTTPDGKVTRTYSLQGIAAVASV